MTQPPGNHENARPEASSSPSLAESESGPALWLLLASDEDSVIEMVRAEARRVGLHVQAAANPTQASAAFDRRPVDLLVLDLAAATFGGLDYAKRARAEHPETTIVVLTEYGQDNVARLALAAGAAESLSRPFEEAAVRSKLERLARTLALDRENRVLREQLGSRPGYGLLVGVSPRMQEVYRRIEKASRSQSSVLILGETGTGKELVARSIHFHGTRKRGPFVPVDCAGLVPTLVESELFGYVKGAFTGAAQSKRGLVEAASGGTLFLDEIGELPMEMQAKLLRVLQQREVRPVGGTASVSVDIRVIAATNRDLEREVERRAFRQDLFYRLNVLPIRVPALRERKSDIPLIVSHLLERFAGDSRPTAVFSEDALERLVSYDWPGNVRELENAISRALALNSGALLHLGDLPTNLQAPAPARLPLDDEGLTLAELERRAIYRALHKTRGDKAATARLLGIGKTTLYRKLKEYGEPEPSGE